MTVAQDKRQQVVGAVVSFGAALTILYFAYTNPPGAHAPVFVLYLAGAAFAAAGATLVLQRFGYQRAQLVPVFLAVACLTAVSGWVAFGRGPRGCSASIGVSFMPGDTTCRAVFGFGTLLSALFALLILRQMFKR